MEENDVEDNPWIANSIFDFCYFCCPECDEKLSVKQDFVYHASNFHEGVSFNTFCSIKKIDFYSIFFYFFPLHTRIDALHCWLEHVINSKNKSPH